LKQLKEFLERNNMNTQEQAYIEGFVKRASEYGFSYNEAIELLKSATAADAPALQNYTPTFEEGIRNVQGNLRNAISHPRQINPINMPMMTGPAGEPQQGLRGIPAMAQNLYSHMNPPVATGLAFAPGAAGLGAAGLGANLSGMNQQSNKVLGNMAAGLWNTPAVK
jgi:hypothetical protein